MTGTLDDKAVAVAPEGEALLAGSLGLGLAAALMMNALETMAETALGSKAREFGNRYAMIGRRALELHDPATLAAIDASAKAGRRAREGARS